MRRRGQPLRARIHQLRVAGHLDRWQQRTELPLLLLAVLFLIVLLAPLAFPDLPADARRVLHTADVVIWSLFALDYAIRACLATDRRRFFRTHILDLIVVLAPLLQPLRAVQAIRVLRILALGGVIARIARHALHVQAVIYVTVLVFLLVTIGSVAVLQVEQGRPGGNIHNDADSVWWALATVTTVGYGDHHPVTDRGRLIGAALMVTGIMMFTVVTASLATWFTQRGRHAHMADDQLGHDIRQLRDEIRAMREQMDRTADRSPDGGVRAIAPAPVRRPVAGTRRRRSRGWQRR